MLQGLLPVFLALLLELAVQEEDARVNSNDIQYRNPEDKQFKIYWNIPTFQCDSHKLNFTNLAEKYNITQNENDRFRGEDIAILYDPGDFPAILKNGTSTVLRNGGVPQEGNLTLHLEIFAALVEELIPDVEFAGIGIIDFESWRPIFRQNFGTLSPYKDLSISIEKRKHPLWPSSWVEKEATKRFELYARRFMEDTLLLAKYLRPNASWGYYAYPYCFNMSPSNMNRNCPKEVTQENDRTKWLFELSDNLYPSIYLGNLRLTANNKVEMVEGRIKEARRVVQNGTKIIPYFWYKYHDTKQFVSKDDVFNVFTVLSTSVIDGVVLWGSSLDVNTKSKCLHLFQYIDDVLGPLLLNSF
ncbi:hypothetical protein NQ315_000302 [Exocentrus adspersus]|uniref:Hyaluronidase n=1 Tax=Exocentrus adspersus TaxID=1586481 RepID=A0AAV8VRJ7_9CUCU|nr:hypothetical protein NQ315_000302 [Exocentrus adspersus]